MFLNPYIISSIALVLAVSLSRTGSATISAGATDILMNRGPTTMELPMPRPTAQNASSGNSTVRSNPFLLAQIMFLQEATSLWTYKAGLLLQRYCLPVIILFGLVGNTLSLLVMLQPQNRKISCCVYMAGLAVSDNGALLTMTYFWVVTDGYPQPWTDFSCKLWVYIVLLTTAGSAFILVVMTADRCLAIRFALKARVWCTAYRAKIGLAITVGCVAIVYIPIALMSGVVDGKVCASFAVKSQLSLVLSYVNLVLIPVIPFVLIVVMNTLIVMTVHQSKKFSQRNQKYSKDGEKTKEEEQEEKANTRNRQLTAMLLMVSIAYIVILLPISCRVLAYMFVDYTRSPEAFAIFVLLYNAINNVLFLNNAINFYLYCIAGAKFREDLKRLCGGVAKSTN